MNNAIDENSLQHKILVEQIIMLYRSTVPSLLFHLLISFILAYALWEVVPQTILIIWMSLMITMLLARGVLFVIFRQRFKPEQAKIYGLFFTIGAVFMGLMWGLGGTVMLPLVNLEYLLMIVLILGVVVISANATLYIYLPAYFAFFLIILLPVAITLIYIGGAIQFSITALVIVATFIAPILAISNNREMKQTFRKI